MLSHLSRVRFIFVFLFVSRQHWSIFFRADQCLCRVLQFELNIATLRHLELTILWKRQKNIFKSSTSHCVFNCFLLWKTSLKKRNARGELCQSVDPAGNLLSAKYLSEGRRKVIAVIVHQMIFVSSKLISYLLDYPPDILF